MLKRKNMANRSKLGNACLGSQGQIDSQHFLTHGKKQSPSPSQEVLDNKSSHSRFEESREFVRKLLNEGKFRSVKEKQEIIQTNRLKVSTEDLRKTTKSEFEAPAKQTLSNKKIHVGSQNLGPQAPLSNSQTELTEGLL